MPIYSHSRLGCYENCPLQYKFHYIDRIKPEEEYESIEAFLGSRVHETLEQLYKRIRMHKRTSLEDALGIYDRLWEKNWSDSVEIVNKDYTAENYLNVGRKCVSDYYNRYQPFSGDRTLGLERRITIKLDDSGDYRMQDYIDRLAERGDGHYEIHDYKTSGAASGCMPESDYFDADRQLALYQIGVEEKFRDVRDVNLVWHYLCFDKEIRSKRTKAQIKALKKETIALIDEIEKATELGNFPMNESGLCGWCQYQELCPKRKHLYKTQQMTIQDFSKDAGVKLVDSYAGLYAQSKKIDKAMEGLKAQMIEYAGKNGIDAIYGRDRKVKVRQYLTVCFPSAGDEERAKLEEIIRKAGKWDDVSVLDTRALAKVVSGEDVQEGWEKALLEKVKTFAEEEKRYEVRLGKAKREEE